MHPIYKDCPYCFHEITIKPILDRNQREMSIRCPHCETHRSKWVATIDEAIVSWNTDGREDDPNIEYLLIVKPVLAK